MEIFVPGENYEGITRLSEYSYAVLIDAFLDRLRNLSANVQKTVVVDNPDSPDLIGIQNLSDWHLGKKVVLNSEVTYDVNIAVKRLKSILENLLRAVEKWKLKKVVIAINGDLVEGAGVNFLHQPYSVDKVLDDQMVLAGIKLWEFVISLSEIVEEVVVIAVSGNHGRAKLPDPTANFDLFVYRYLAHMLNTHQERGEYQNVRLYISTEAFINYAPNEHLKLHVRHLTRVKQIKTAAGRARFLAICATHNVNAVLSGHWHNPTFEMAQDKWNIINGSLVGMDTYAEELNLKSGHAQVFNVFDRDKMVGLEIFY